MKLKIWLTSLALIVCASPALAHNLWLAPSDYNPEPGKELEVNIGFGHKFPASRIDEKVRPGMLQEVTAIGPKCGKIPMTKKNDGRYSLKVKEQGSYMLSAFMKPGYFSQGKGGFKRGNKQQLEGVKKCMYFRMIANAPIFARSDANAASPPGKQALRIKPLAGIAALMPGGKLPIQVVFNGSPVAGAEVRATYAGFKPPAPPESKKAKSGQKLSPKEAALQRMKRRMAARNRYPVIVKTDAQGKADINLSAPGWWLLVTKHSMPYRDKSVCDENVFATTYTFEVR